MSQLSQLPNISKTGNKSPIVIPIITNYNVIIYEKVSLFIYLHNIHMIDSLQVSKPLAGVNMKFISQFKSF